MPKSSEVREYPDISYPQVGRKPHLESLPGGLVEEVEVEAIVKVPNKVQKKIAKKVAACISAGIVASTGGFIALGETGNLPEQVQEWYDNTADGVRAFFGIEEKDQKPVVVLPSETTPQTTAVETTPITTAVETAPATTEISKETTETTAALKEFEASMIKNRFHFTNDVQKEEEWFVPTMAVPLWFVQEWKTKGYEYVASGVMAGLPRKEIGLSGKEELVISFAFQNPKTNKFFIRDISFDNEDSLKARAIPELGEGVGYWGVCYIENYKYKSAGQRGDTELFEDILKNFQVGDQIAFIFSNDWDPADGNVEEFIKENPDRLDLTFAELYFANNKAFYEAMKGNKDLPNLTINPNLIIVNKLQK